MTPFVRQFVGRAFTLELMLVRDALRWSQKWRRAVGRAYGPCILDATGIKERVGSAALRLRLDELRKLRLHVFGHIH